MSGSHARPWMAATMAGWCSVSGAEPALPVGAANLSGGPGRAGANHRLRRSTRLDRALVSSVSGVCLLIVLAQTNAGFPLIVGANRHELLDRPATPTTDAQAA